MLQRTSSVDNIRVDTTIFSSIFQIGDSTCINGFSRALAVHRETQLFYGKEGSFAEYPVFNKPIPLLPIDENFSMATFHLCPLIKVRNIKINGISSSSILKIGSSRNINMEARVKHIRQLLPLAEEQTEENMEK